MNAIPSTIYKVINFQEKSLIPPFRIYLGFWMVLGHYDVVVGLFGSLQVVFGRCRWFRLVVDGFSWFSVVLGGLDGFG